jgi:hypothetical protein
MHLKGDLMDCKDNLDIPTRESAGNQTQVMQCVTSNFTVAVWP